MAYRHFSHRHPLLISDEKLRHEECQLCGQFITSGMLHASCYGCNVHFHKSCANLPENITHPFHPHHALTLKASSSSYLCNACGIFGNGESRRYYHCSECKFCLHIACSTLKPALTNPPTIHHPHPLVLCYQQQNDVLDFDISPCSECEMPFNKLPDVPVYVCLECAAMLHESCAALPQEIISHPFHSNHPLTIRTGMWFRNRSFDCNACRKRTFGAYFECSKCDFKLDLPCSTFLVSKPDKNDQNSTPIIEHNHPLIRCEINNLVNFPRTCPGCCQAFANGSAYFCVSCNIMMHKSCFELPHQIQHSLHMKHPMTLTSIDYLYKKNSCRICHSYSKGLKYRCKDCRFYLDPKCAFANYSVIQTQFHQHPLVFVDFIIGGNYYMPCNSCEKSCTNDFLFMCSKCMFHLHVHCLPELPAVVKYKNHWHPLTLTDSQIRDFPEEDEDGEFYCDACEESRDLNHPAYYSEETHYVAHVHCVISEVFELMKESGKIELETSSCKHQPTDGA